MSPEEIASTIGEMRRQSGRDQLAQAGAGERTQLELEIGWAVQRAIEAYEVDHGITPETRLAAIILDTFDRGGLLAAARLIISERLIVSATDQP